MNPIPHKDSILLFEGGNDVNPALYKQLVGHRTQKPDIERDIHEQSYFEMAKSVGAAMIGVCRGAQLLCVLNGGSLIQDAKGHQVWHQIAVPDKYDRIRFQTSSAHHQVMNPYVLPKTDWQSFGYAINHSPGKYKDGNNSKVKVYKCWPEWRDQEIVWFKKTKSLSIQGHPEWFKDQDAFFVKYCKFLVNFLLFRDEETRDGKIQTP